MPDYRKKKIRKAAARPPKKKNTGKKTDNADIIMSSERKEKSQKEKNVRVIKGKKLERKRKLGIFSAAIIFAAATICILHFILPIGIIENIGNLTASFGSGAYPIELYGTEVISTAQKGSYYYVLTDSDLSAYSNGGKKIFLQSHGYAKPILKTSQTRALIFDQGGTELQIYNLRECTNTLKSEQQLLTAAISRCGAYAIATASENYTAEITVFDKDDNKMYQWYSATDLVNGILISPDGKKLAVSTVNASNGILKSKISVFEYSSADPVFSTEYTGTAVYSLEALNSGFSGVTSQGCCYFNWKNLSCRDYPNEYEPALSSSTSYGLALVFSRTSDKSDNHILVLSHKGEQLAAFNFSGTISDIAFSDNHIYCISESSVYMLDKQGELVAEAACGFGAEKLSVTDSRSVAVITGGDINKIHFN